MENKRLNREIEILKKDPSISNVNFTDNKLTLDFEDPTIIGNSKIIKYIIGIPEDYPLNAPIVSYKRPLQTTYTTVVIKDWTPARLLGGIIKTAGTMPSTTFDIEGGKRRRKTRRRKTKRRRLMKSRRYRK